MFPSKAKQSFCKGYSHEKTHDIFFTLIILFYKTLFAKTDESSRIDQHHDYREI